MLSQELVEHMCANRDHDAKNWIFSVIESLSHEELILLVVTIWAIWSAMRKAIHDDIFQSPLSSHCFISSYLIKLQILDKPRREVSGHLGSDQGRANMRADKGGNHPISLAGPCTRALIHCSVN